MFVFITALYVSVLLLIFYIVLTLRYKKFLEKKEVLAERRNKEIHIAKFISEEKKDDVKKKLAKISQIIAYFSESSHIGCFSSRWPVFLK